MRALNKQQLRVISSGLEPGVEDLIMDKVLPAKRVAIEKFTDRADRLGFTDTNDPYTSCLREIDRRMKGTAFDNPVDDDDLKCRAIALVADKHDEILAAKDSAEREAMQHAIPQKVFDSFLRNKFPKIRFLKTLPDKVRLPGGEIFTVNQSPADPARNSMIVGPDEETGQDGFINAAIPTEPRGGQLPGLDADIQGGSEVGPLERLILPDQRPELAGDRENSPVPEQDQPEQNRDASSDLDRSNPIGGSENPGEPAFATDDEGNSVITVTDPETGEQASIGVDQFLEALPPELNTSLAREILLSQVQAGKFSELPFLNTVEIDFSNPEALAQTARELSAAANQYGLAGLIATAMGPEAIPAAVTFGLLALRAGVAGQITTFAAELAENKRNNLELAYNVWRGVRDKNPDFAQFDPENENVDPATLPFEVRRFLTELTPEARNEFFESLLKVGAIRPTSNMSNPSPEEAQLAFAEMNDTSIKFVQFEAGSLDDLFISIATENENPARITVLQFLVARTTRLIDTMMRQTMLANAGLTAVQEQRRRYQSLLERMLRRQEDNDFRDE